MAYTPRFVTETNVPPPWRLCTMAAGAMLIDAVTEGDIRRTAVQMSNLAGKGVYPPRGTTLQDLERSFAKLGHNLDRRFSPWEKVPHDTWCVFQGWMGYVPPEYRAPLGKRYTKGHALFGRIEGPSDDGRTFIMDPLGKSAATYTGTYWPTPVLRAMMLGMTPFHKCYLGVGPKYESGAITGEEPMITAGGLTITSDHVVPLKAGTRVYRSPDTAADSYSVNAAVRPSYMGIPDGASAWKAILVKTGNFYDDGVARPTIAYVKGGTVE